MGCMGGVAQGLVQVVHRPLLRQLGTLPMSPAKQRAKLELWQSVAECERSELASQPQALAFADV